MFWLSVNMKNKSRDFCGVSVTFRHLVKCVPTVQMIKLQLVKFTSVSLSVTQHSHTFLVRKTIQHAYLSVYLSLYRRD